MLFVMSILEKGRSDCVGLVGIQGRVGGRRAAGKLWMRFVVEKVLLVGTHCEISECARKRGNAASGWMMVADAVSGRLLRVRWRRS